MVKVRGGIYRFMLTERCIIHGIFTYMYINFSGHKNRFLKGDRLDQAKKRKIYVMISDLCNSKMETT